MSGADLYIISIPVIKDLKSLLFHKLLVKGPSVSINLSFLFVVANILSNDPFSSIFKSFLFSSLPSAKQYSFTFLNSSSNTTAEETLDFFSSSGVSGEELDSNLLRISESQKQTPQEAGFFLIWGSSNILFIFSINCFLSKTL